MGWSYVRERPTNQTDFRENSNFRSTNQTDFRENSDFRIFKAILTKASLKSKLANRIERKLEGVCRLANRRLSPKPEQQTASTRRRKGGGKDARSASLEIEKRFPLSHRHGEEPTVTLQMFRRSSLGLNSQMA